MMTVAQANQANETLRAIWNALKEGRDPLPIMEGFVESYSPNSLSEALDELPGINDPYDEEFWVKLSDVQSTLRNHA